MVKPCYVFSGFLDSGKTTAIKDILSYGFNEGDRVLVEGRAYIRDNTANPEKLPELSVTATGMFLLGRKRRQSFNSGLIPQK